ncbi:hypothetical protein [Alteribacter populi]|uniref:hypothetical protein n=1 Tax=Alteribacter populi TaxID=2011011 RepID=UPI000BBB2DB5|nr:hypothetical protein [Alteribacter populi]
MAQEDQNWGGSIFDRMMFGDRAVENYEETELSKEQTEDQEQTDESQLPETGTENEMSPEQMEQMEQTMNQIAAIMEFANQMKPYVKQLSPLWEAIKKFSNSK